MPMLTPPPSGNFIETLRSRIVEGRTIDPYEYRPIVIPLQVVLGSSRQQGTATFNVPSNQRMLLLQLTPIVVPSLVSSSDDTVTGEYTVGVPAAGDVFAGGVVIDRLLAKMENCRVSLQFNSTVQGPFFTQQSYPLSSAASLYGEVFGLADMPMPVVQGTTINMTASLSDINAAGGDTEYGFALLGAYIQV